MHLLIWETKNVQKNQIAAKATYGSFILTMVFLIDLQTGLLEQLTSSIGYDAEATVAFNESKIIYTSIVSGDLDIWTLMDQIKNK